MTDNTLLKLSPKFDYVQREIYLHQGKYTYESHIVHWINNYLLPGMTMVDIGAHIGYYLGPVCKNIGATGSAIFLEPLPEHFNLLQSNIEANIFGWAKPVNMAISDQTGQITFYPAVDSGRNSLAKNKITDRNPILVQAITLDHLVKTLDITRIDLLQIDVEGAEVLVIKGAKQCLEEKKIQAILCEWHPQQIRCEFNADPQNLIDNLKDYGFRVSCIQFNTGIEIDFDPQRAEEYQHLLFSLDKSASVF